MVKKYCVGLTEEDRRNWGRWYPRAGLRPISRPTRILLLSDENQAEGAMKDQEIARALRVGTATVERLRRPVRGAGG